MEKWEEKVKPLYQELDYTCHLKIEAIMNTLSDIATTHAGVIGLWNEKMEGQYGWIVSKMRLKIHQPITSSDRLIVKTWPNIKSKVIYPRYYTIEKEDGTMCVEAVGIWTLLDLLKRRIVIPGKVGLTFPSDLIEEAPIEVETSFIYDDIEFETVETRTVKYSEVDVNQHLNNTKYMSYALDILDFNKFKTHYIEDVSIYFKKETEPNQTMILEKYEKDDRFIVRGRIEEEVHFIVEGLWNAY